MKSAVNIMGHPLHTILIVFPVAFFTGTLFFDILATAGNNYRLSIAAYYLHTAGLITAVAAAIPGILDFFYTVPPKSSGKKRALQHGVLNSINLVLYFIAWLLKQSANTGALWVIIIESAGFILLCAAAWMGGTLVYRNQIGIDIRYAEAGKWKEERINSTSTVIQIAFVEDLKINQMKLLHVNGRRIVLGKTEKGFVAFEDGCSHKGGSLTAGSMICGTVQCPWHGSQFDLVTGVVKAGPAKNNIVVYKTIEKDGKVYLLL